MIQILIFAAVAFLFWGKVTKEEEEKIQNASWIRTTIFLTLTIMIGVFYVKTYQVATVKNVVIVDGHRCAQNSKTLAVVDTIEEICVMNRYTDTSPFASIAYLNYEDSSIFDSDSNGGLDIIFKLKYDSSCIIKANSYNPSISPRIYHDYLVQYMATQVPRISIFQKQFAVQNDKPTILMEKHMTTKDFSCDLSNRQHINPTKFTNFVGSHGIYNALQLYSWDIGTMDSYEEEYQEVVNSDAINTFDFFTAADISQCSYIIGFKTDCPLKRFVMNFDIPVEILPIPYRIDVNSAYGFEINNQETINRMQRTMIAMHVKFPTLANMQLIRSLILTTILSAILSLFLTNLYYLLCKIVRYMKTKSKYEHNSHKIKFRKGVYSIFVIVICIIIVSASICILRDNYYWLDASSLDLESKATTIIIVVLLTLFAILEFYTLKRKK